MHRLIAARVATPEAWFQEVSAAILVAKGRLPVAAAAMGVSLPTLKRWVAADARLRKIRPTVPKGWKAWTVAQQARASKMRSRKRGPKKKDAG